MCQAIDDKYKAMVLDILASNSGEIIENYSMDHANFLAEKMFERAGESMCMLTGEFFRNDAHGVHRAFSDMVARLEACTQARQPAVRVVATRIGAVPAWIEEIRRRHPGALKIVRARERDPENPKIHHFFVSDGKMFRYEEPHKAGTENVHARVGFNNPESAQLLQEQFDRVWDRFSAAASEESKA